ncbi:Uncharacterised protein [Mycobacteroides abscessus subsp. abscessus]|nr:Uncharacterised protein [Mycobacteroides abscessus subsp. abscessus]
MSLQYFLGWSGCSVSSDNECMQYLPEVVIGYPDDDGIGNTGVRGQAVLHFTGEDIFAAGDNHVVGTAIDVQPAVGIEMSHIAGIYMPVNDLLGGRPRGLVGGVSLVL